MYMSERVGVRPSVTTGGTVMDVQLEQAFKELTGKSIKEFQAEAAEWAKEARQCKDCEAWARLGEFGLCWPCSKG